MARLDTLHVVATGVPSRQFRELTQSSHVDAGDEEGLRDWLATCFRIFYRGADPAEDASVD